MSGPEVAVAGAPLAIARSAIRWAVVVAIAESLVALASSAGLEAATVAALALGPVVGELMCTTMVEVWVALGARVPRLRVPGSAVLPHPALVGTRLTWAGSTSVTVPPLEADGPLLVTMRV